MLRALIQLAFPQAEDPPRLGRWLAPLMLQFVLHPIRMAGLVRQARNKRKVDSDLYPLW